MIARYEAQKQENEFIRSRRRERSDSRLTETFGSPPSSSSPDLHRSLVKPMAPPFTQTSASMRAEGATSHHSLASSFSTSALPPTLASSPSLAPSFRGTLGGKLCFMATFNMCSLQAGSTSSADRKIPFLVHLLSSAFIDRFKLEWSVFLVSGCCRKQLAFNLSL